MPDPRGPRRHCRHYRPAAAIATTHELLGPEAEIMGSSDHLWQELRLVVETARRKVLDTARVVTRTVPLDTAAINQTLDALEHFSGGVRRDIVP